MMNINEEKVAEEDFIKTKEVYTTCNSCNYTKNGTKEKQCLYCKEKIDTSYAQDKLIELQLKEYLEGYKHIGTIDYIIKIARARHIIFRTSKFGYTMSNTLRYMGFEKYTIIPFGDNMVEVEAFNYDLSR